MNTTGTPVLLLRFLVFVLATNVAIAGFFGPKTHETIINRIQPATDLTVHCKSKDDDLGIHVLPPAGNYSFSFRQNFWGTTLFFCGVKWKFSTLKYFDIYDYGRNDAKYVINIWNIGVNGPCRFNWDTNQYDDCYSWK